MAVTSARMVQPCDIEFDHDPPGEQSGEEASEEGRANQKSGGDFTADGGLADTAEQVARNARCLDDHGKLNDDAQE